MDPIAQGDQQNEETQQHNEPAVSPGLQARIDELTANFRETQRELQRRDEMIQQLVMAQTQRQAPAQEEPQYDIDEDDRKKFEYLFKSQTAPLLQQIEQLNRQVVTQRAQSLREQAGDPEVANIASELLVKWQNHPVYRNATEEDALNIAWGMKARKQSQNQAQRNEYNNLPAPIVGGRAAPVSPRSSSNLNNLSVEELAGRLGSIEEPEFEF